MTKTKLKYIGRVARIDGLPAADNDEFDQRVINGRCWIGRMGERAVLLAKDGVNYFVKWSGDKCWMCFFPYLHGLREHQPVSEGLREWLVTKEMRE